MLSSHESHDHMTQHVCCGLAIQAERTILTIDKGKELYGLESHELVWEQRHDTKCLMGLGPDTILLVFRGPASLKNASADLQVRSMHDAIILPAAVRNECIGGHTDCAN